MKACYEKKTVLVLCEAYPDPESKAMMYVHTRNKYYLANNIDVVVLCFSCTKEYYYEGIRVIPYKTFNNETTKYNTLIIHAANLRHHLLFLLKHNRKFEHLVFFFHGHEVLKVNSVYPKPYYYMKGNQFKIFLQNIYDDMKFTVWRMYIPYLADKSDFVFVSEWMKNEFLKWTRIPYSLIEKNTSVIYNCVSKEFEEGSFNDSGEKDFDFITIRGNLDESKYSVDIVNRLANNTKCKKFLVVGKGKFFSYFPKAENITWINTNLTHKEILVYLDKAEYALMPTRTDAQGLMMCEMAAYGIPVITSDIEVCHEVFMGFENAYFINNNDDNIDLNKIDLGASTCLKLSRYNENMTVKKEIEIIKRR